MSTDQNHNTTSGSHDNAGTSLPINPTNPTMHTPATTFSHPHIDAPSPTLVSGPPMYTGVSRGRHGLPNVYAPVGGPNQSIFSQVPANIPGLVTPVVPPGFPVLQFVPNPASSELVNHLQFTNSQLINYAMQISQYAGDLLRNLTESKLLLKRIGLLTFLRCRIETYELVLSIFPPSAPLRSATATPSTLHMLPHSHLEATMKHSFSVHFNKWMNIVNSSSDPRRPAIRHNITLLGFNSVDHFCHNIAILFVHLSNSIHPMPLDSISWSSEDEVISVLRDWLIVDPWEQNACRILYRLPSL